MLVKLLQTPEENWTKEKQNEAQATFCKKIKKEDGELRLNAPAEDNWRKYRAYADSIGTYFFEKGKRMKITEAALEHFG